MCRNEPVQKINPILGDFGIVVRVCNKLALDYKLLNINSVDGYKRAHCSVVQSGWELRSLRCPQTYHPSSGVAGLPSLAVHQ